MKVILSSKSPRRKELLQLIIPEFEILPSDAEETLQEGLDLEEQVVALAYLKAKNVFEKTEGDRIVIGSDTIVTKNNKIYGKPNSKKHAKEMLKELLQGDKSHKVITGLSVIIQRDGKYEEHKTYDEAKVYFKDIDDKEIEKWINSGKAMDKAGAYGIQNEFCVFIDKIEGNYTTVVGLPTHKVYEAIRKYI